MKIKLTYENFRGFVCALYSFRLFRFFIFTFFLRNEEKTHGVRNYEYYVFNFAHTVSSGKKDLKSVSLKADLLQIQILTILKYYVPHC